MRKTVLAIAFVTAIGALSIQPAGAWGGHRGHHHSGSSLSINFGTPVYYAPQPVYYAPAPVYGYTYYKPYRGHGYYGHNYRSYKHGYRDGRRDGWRDRRYW